MQQKGIILRWYARHVDEGATPVPVALVLVTRRIGREGNGRSFLRSGDLPLEQTGLRIGEDGKICITKASLERVDASMRQQMRMVIPLKSIKESSAVAITPTTTISPQRIIREERRAREGGGSEFLGEDPFGDC